MSVCQTLCVWLSVCLLVSAWQQNRHIGGGCDVLWSTQAFRCRGNKTRVRAKYESGPLALEWFELLLLSRSLAGINVWIYREAEAHRGVCVRVMGSDWYCFRRQGCEVIACCTVLHYNVFLATWSSLAAGYENSVDNCSIAKRNHRPRTTLRCVW